MSPCAVLQTEALPTSAVPSSSTSQVEEARPRRSWLAAALREHGFTAHQVPHMVDHVDKSWRPGQPRVLLVEARLDDLLDVTRARRHDRDPLGEEHRLLHIVG